MKEMNDSPLMTLGEAASIMKGFLVSGNPDCQFFSVSIDSRKTEKGSLFFALKGEKTDGHEFTGSAAASGACCCVVEKESSAAKKDGEDGRCLFIVVDNTLKALHLLAAGYRNKFRDICIAGITGSSGKTTTKELLASILEKEAKTVMNEGNLNSETGLPLSIFRIRDYHRFGVFEVGINHTGEMDVLVNILKPDYAIITNIGSAHIGMFGSRDVIAEEKTKILTETGNLKAGIIYENDDYALMAREKGQGKVGFYGFDSQKDYVSVSSAGLDGSVIQLGAEKVKFPLVGRHNQLNALAAICAARHLGVSDAKIREALESAKPLFSRGEIIRGAVTVISDCYNSNLESVRFAVEFLDSVEWKGRKAILLGSIFELGKSSAEIHLKAACCAIESSADSVFLFGDELRESYENSGNGRKHLFWSNKPEEMAEILAGYLCEGDLILLKGSRGMALERFLEPIGKINRMVSSC